jgi:hypothetical protein
MTSIELATLEEEYGLLKKLLSIKGRQIELGKKEQKKIVSDFNIPSRHIQKQIKKGRVA